MGLIDAYSLHTLDLGVNQIGDAGAKALAEDLAKNMSLHTLDLRCNEINVAGTKALAEALAKNMSLHSLGLRGNKINEAGAKALAEALAKNISLHTLNLFGNQIGDAGAKALAEALAKNTSLHSLSLRENQIGEAGVKALAEALAKNTNLHSLDLMGNQIGDVGAKALAEALAKNMSLHSLKLYSNQIGDAGAKALAEALAKNTSLHSLDLRANKIGEAAQAEIEKTMEARREKAQPTHQKAFEEISKQLGLLATMEGEALRKLGKAHYLKNYQRFWIRGQEHLECLESSKQEVLKKPWQALKDRCETILSRFDIASSAALSAPSYSPALEYKIQAETAFKAPIVPPISSEQALSKEMRELLHTAQAGDAAAQYLLGWRYANGQGIAMDKKLACEWYRKAADQGDAAAQCSLGLRYADGQGVAKDEKLACDWFRKAAEQGDAAAQYSLGVRYADGQGVTKDEKLACDWCRKAAEQGHAAAKIEVTRLEQLFKLSVATPSAPVFISTIASASSLLETKERSEQQIIPSIVVETKVAQETATLRQSADFQQQLLQHQAEIEKKLQQMMHIIQTRDIDTSPKTEQEIIDGVLQQLFEQQETLQVLPTTLQSIEDELQSLKKSAAQMQSEVARLRAKATDDPLVRAQLAALEQQVQLLLEEYEERQKILQAQQYIFQHLPLKTFYLRVQAKLNQFFLAYMAITSGQIDRSADKKNITITLLDKPLQVLTLGLGSALTSGMNALYNRKQKKKISGLADSFVISITTSEAAAERVARGLTLRYEDQIKDTTVPGQEGLFSKVTISYGPNGGAETLAECAVVRMIDALRGDKINKDKPLDVQLIDCVFPETSKHGVIPLINQTIQTVSKKKWTDQGIFRHSGIRTEKEWFAGKKDCCHKPEKYGYRWGTIEEAMQLGLVAQKGPSVASTVSMSPAFGQHIKGVAEDTKAVKDVQEHLGELLRHEKERNTKLVQKVEVLERQQERDRTEREVERIKVQRLEELMQGLLAAKTDSSSALASKSGHSAEIDRGDTPRPVLLSPAASKAVTSMQPLPQRSEVTTESQSSKP